MTIKTSYFFIPICLTLFLTQNSVAQIHFGFKGGLNYSKNQIISSEEDLKDENTEYLFGFHTGLISNYDFNEKWSLSLEIIYTQKGFKYQENSIPFYGASDGEIRLNYIGSPILLGYMIHDKIKIILGPEFAYLLSAKETSAQGKDDDVDWAGNTDYLINFGVNYSLTHQFELGLRYSHGLKTVTEMVINPDYGKYLNRTIELSAALKVN